MSLREHFINKLLLILLVLPGLAMAAPSYSMTWLPQDFAAAALDGVGRVVGWSGLEDNFNERPFLFSPEDGGMIDLGTVLSNLRKANHS